MKTSHCRKSLVAHVVAHVSFGVAPRWDKNILPIPSLGISVWGLGLGRLGFRDHIMMKIPFFGVGYFTREP